MMLQKGVYHRENKKIHHLFQHLVKADLISLANTYTNSGPCTIPLRVSTHVPAVFVAFAVGALRKYPCNNVQVQRVV